MDVERVTEQYTELIARQRLTLRKAKARQGQRPRDLKPREEACAKFMLIRMVTMSQGVGGEGVEIRSSFAPPAYPPCIADMASLSRTAIRHLQLETHHRGTYLLLRAITPPSRMTAIMAIMEDENDNVLLLQLYQQEDEHTFKAADIVDVGTILIIKEPYFKVAGDGEYCLRVDHLSDVVHVNRNHLIVPEKWRPRLIEVGYTAECVKIKGNVAMGEGKYRDAITTYSCALDQPATASEIDTIKRNRSLAFLKIQRFDAALADTGYPTFNPKPPEKALFRAAEALYYLGRFKECLDVLELLHKSFPDNNQGLIVLRRARDRCLEQKTGVYIFKQLQSKAKKLQPPHLDLATYIGPVEVKQAGSKGRGLFVTRAVKAGDLLFCEKAFSSTYTGASATGQNINGSNVSLLWDSETGKAFLGGQADLIKNIVQKLHRNPSLAPAFTTLYHGDYEKVSTSTVDAETIVDTFLVHRIVTFNVFGCPVSSLESYKDLMADVSSVDKYHQSCGIWTLASYINHSCTSTSRRSFIGDMMIVRASCDMEPGTEVTFWYHSPFNNSDVKELQRKLSHWGFVCDCALCRYLKSTGSAVIKKRKALLETLQQVFERPRGNQLERAERLLDALNATYTHPAEEVPRVLLWEQQLSLTRGYVAQKNVSKTLQSARKVLTSLGFVVDDKPFTVVKWGLTVDRLVEVFMHARDALEAIGLREDARRADGYARTAYAIVVGEEESFDATHG